MVTQATWKKAISQDKDKSPLPVFITVILYLAMKSVHVYVEIYDGLATVFFTKIMEENYLVEFGYYIKTEHSSFL